MSFYTLVSDAAALFLLWLLLQAGLHKLKPSNQSYYRDLLADYGGVFKKFAEVLSPALGVVECLLGLALVIPASRSAAAAVALLLLGGYFLALAWQLYQGKKDMDCGCAGPGFDLKISPALLWRNAALMLVAASCFTGGSGFGLWQSLNALAFALVLVLIYICSEGLLANAQKIKALRSS